MELFTEDHSTISDDRNNVTEIVTSCVSNIYLLCAFVLRVMVNSNCHNCDENIVKCAEGENFFSKLLKR